MAELTLLDLDLEGDSPANRRVNEEHALITVRGKTNRVLVTDFGAFYTNGLTVRDANGKALVRGRDYVLTYFYEQLTQLTGQGVCGLVVVTDTTAVSPVRVTYQAVGGHWNISVKELLAAFELLESNTIKIKWEDIIGKPDAYNPADHTHKYWQLYGMESTVENLNRLGDAYKYGDTVLMKNNQTFYTGIQDLAKKAVDDYNAAITKHITDLGNPHQSDKAKVGLSELNNWPMATGAQSLDTTLNNVYMPIGGVYGQLARYSIPTIQNHSTRTDNPHRLSLDALNMYPSASIQGLFNGLLAIGMTAVTSNALSGAGHQQFVADVQWNIATSELDGSRFTPNYFAPPLPFGNTPDTRYVLCGDYNYRRLADLLAPYADNTPAVYFVGGSGALNTVESAIQACRETAQRYGLSSVKPGTYAIGTFQGNMLDNILFTQYLVVCYYDGSQWVPQLYSNPT